MEKKNSLTLNKQNQKDLTDYCKLNNIEDVEIFFQQCFKQGFDIKKYGLIGENNERVIEYIEKEVIVEVIKEVVVEQKIFSTNEVIVEKIVQVPIEVEKIVEKIVQVEKPNDKMGMLQETLMKLRKEIGEKDKTIIELNNKIEQLEKLVSNTGAVFMKGSNLLNNI
jgi:hypothetical protein